MPTARRRCTAALFMLLASGSCCAQMQLVHSERSLYREVLVYEYAGQRCICFTRECRVGRQSCQSLERPREFVMNYTRMMLGGALYMNPDPRRILIVGLGGGTLPTALAQLLPGAQIDVVEIDPAVTRVAQRYFGFKPGAHLQVIEDDGRRYVKRAARAGTKYDLIMLDAFDHQYIPEHLLTREYLGEVKSLLAPDGVLAANTFSSSRLYDHESTTYAAVYGEFYNLKRENRVILARPAGLPDAALLQTRAAQWQAALRPYGMDELPLLGMFDSKPDWNTSARILTDQYSPANLLNRTDPDQ
jgi:spermidine synthase